MSSQTKMDRFSGVWSMTDGLYQKIERDMKERWALDEKLEKRERGFDGVAIMFGMGAIMLIILTVMIWMVGREVLVVQSGSLIGGCVVIALICKLAAKRAAKQRRMIKWVNRTQSEKL